MSHKTVIQACRSGEVDLLRSSLDSSVDVNREVDADGNTLLHLAVSCRDCEPVVKLLLDRDADPNVVNHKGQTPLHLSLRLSNTESILQLMNFDRDKQKQVVQMLIEKAAKLDARDCNGITALHKAVNLANGGMVKQLLDCGANPNVGNIRGQTPLFYSRNDKYTDLLLAGGADPNWMDNKGETALHHVVRLSLLNKRKLVKALLDGGANPNIRNYEGFTPLHICASLLMPETGIIGDLLKGHANPNIEDKRGDTPLFLSCNTTHVSLLLEAGADPNWINNEGETVLHRVVRRSSVIKRKLVKALLSGGADPNVRDRDGDTPLHLCASCSPPEIGTVSELLKGNANPNAINERGEIPEDLANDSHVEEILQDASENTRFVRHLPKEYDSCIICYQNPINMKLNPLRTLSDLSQLF